MLKKPGSGWCEGIGLKSWIRTWIRSAKNAGSGSGSALQQILDPDLDLPLKKMQDPDLDPHCKNSWIRIWIRIAKKIRIKIWIRMAKNPGSETMILCEQGECPGVPALPGLRASDLLPVPLLLRVHREAPRHGATTTIHEGVVYRWARKMDDKDIAPNTVHTAGPVGMGRKSRQYTIFQYSTYTGRTYCP